MNWVLFFACVTFVCLCSAAGVPYAPEGFQQYFFPENPTFPPEGPTNGGQTPAGPSPPCVRPKIIDCFDENCFCQYDWIGPPGFYSIEEPYTRLKDLYYGDFFDYESWSPEPILFGYPCEVCFVTIRGPGVTFVDRDTKVNTLTIGGNQWDQTKVFVGGAGRSTVPVILTVGYYDIPRIKRVDGRRLCNGQTLITITGTGFGFCADDLTVTVADHTEDRPKWYEYDATANCDYPLPDGCQKPGVPSIIPVPGDVYECKNVRISYLDEQITCTVSISDVFAQRLWVKVQVNVRIPPVSDQVEWLTTYVK